MKEQNFSTKKRWVSSDGWRGYEEPLYYVAGANDTGTYSDSPCHSDVATKELNEVKSLLRKSKIKYREIYLKSSNVFCAHRYIIVTPAQFELAKDIVNEYYVTAKSNTRLLYVND